MVSTLLPDGFSVLLDGWSEDDTHYVSVFASIPSDDPSGYGSLLLAPAQMGDEDNTIKDDLYAYMEFVLSVYDNTMSKIDSFVEDN